MSVNCYIRAMINNYLSYLLVYLFPSIHYFLFLSFILAQ